MSDTINDEKELEILETIHAAGLDDKPVVQRDIAHIVGVSLGMTNAILKRLAKKGFLTIRKVNNRNIHYAVSPEGLKMISERSYRYFKRTIKNVVFYKEKIEKIIEDAKDDGFEKVVLVGESDLDFIVEHFCMHYGLRFTRAAANALEKGGDTEPGAKAFIFYSENIAADKVSGENVCGLRDITFL